MQWNTVCRYRRLRYFGFFLVQPQQGAGLVAEDACHRWPAPRTARPAVGRQGREGHDPESGSPDTARCAPRPAPRRPSAPATPHGSRAVWTRTACAGRRIFPSQKSKSYLFLLGRGRKLFVLGVGQQGGSIEALSALAANAAPAAKASVSQTHPAPAGPRRPSMSCAFSSRVKHPARCWPPEKSR